MGAPVWTSGAAHTRAQTPHVPMAHACAHKRADRRGHTRFRIPGFERETAERARPQRTVAPHRRSAAHEFLIRAVQEVLGAVLVGEPVRLDSFTLDPVLRLIQRKLDQNVEKRVVVHLDHGLHGLLTVSPWQPVRELHRGGGGQRTGTRGTAAQRCVARPRRGGRRTRTWSA